MHGLSLQAFYPIEERHDEYEKDNFIVDVEEEAHDGKNMWWTLKKSKEKRKKKKKQKNN